MKSYEIIVDGYKVGIEEFTAEEVRALQGDAGILLIAVER